MSSRTFGDLQLGGSLEMMASADVRKLINSNDLQRLLEQSAVYSDGMRSMEDRYARSRSLRDSQTRSLDLLGQFGLSRSEVERWMHQNGPQASPSGVSQGTPPSSFNSFGASHLPAFTRTAPQVPIPTSIAHERGIPIMAPAGYPSVLASGGGAQHPPIFSGSGSSGSLGSAGLGPFAHRVDSANQTMQTFESQIRWVAHQAAKLRTQSQHLRSDNRIDPNRVDGLLAMLRNATLGEEEQHRVGVVKPSAVHSSPPKSERAEDVRYDETRRGATGARRRNHRQDQTEILRQWFDDHAADPYPTPNEKAVLAKRVGMEVRQVEHWFTNHRKRHWLKQDQEGAQAGSATGSQDHCSGAGALLSMSGGRSGTCDVSMDDAE